MSISEPERSISELARRFRAAIEATPRSRLPISFEHFPDGSCGDATLLLAKFLERRGCGRFEYIAGERAEQSHAWLEQGDLIIDITGDQFQDMADRVFVGRQSAWHDSFQRETRGIADFENYDDLTRRMLGAAYEYVMQNVDR